MTGTRAAPAVRRLAGATLLLAVSTPAFAAGDVEEGHLLARQWCAECHIVDADQAAGSADVPPFVEIAHSESLTTEGLSAFLANPHPVMPNMPLSRDEISHLVAYIQSLKTD